MSGAIEAGKVQLTAAVNADGISTGVEAGKRKLTELGEAAKKAGLEGSSGLKPLGDEGLTAAGKLDRATSSIISSAQRATASLNSLGKSRSDFLQSLAVEKGADLSQIEPYIARLREAEQAHRGGTTAARTFSNEVKTVGVSAAATANAMRMIPAQMTDIVVSLQGGQAPMTVLLQQGGQLKDMFGGLGPAMRAVGGYVAAMINPFTIAAAAVAALAFAYKQGSDESKAFNTTLILSGNAAGVTSSQFINLSRSLAPLAGSQHAAAAALAEMAGSTRIAGADLEKFTAVAARMDRLVGQPVETTRKEFEELGKSPVEAILKLNDKYNFLTAATYKQIKALEDQGKGFEAARLAQNTYADAMDGKLDKLQANLGIIEKAWKGIKDGAAAAWNAMLNIGRTDSIDTQLAQVEARIAGQAKMIEAVKASGIGAVAQNSQIRQINEQTQALEAQRAALLLQQSAEAEVAGWKAKQLQLTRDQASWDEQGKQVADNKAKREKEIAEAKALALRLGLDEEALQKRIKAIEEKYKDPKVAKGGKTPEQLQAEEYKRIVEELLAVRVKYTGETEHLTESEKILLKVLQDGKWSAITEEQRKAAQSVADRNEVIRQEMELEKQRAALLLISVNAQVDEQEKNASINESIRSKIAAQDEQTRKLGESKLGILRIDQEALDVQLAQVEAAILLARAQGKPTAELETQLTLLKQLKDSLRATFDKQQVLDLDQGVRDAAKAAEQEWSKTSDQIGQALANALVAGGTSGWDTIKNYVKSNFLVPVIKMLFSPISNAAGSLVGSLVGSASTGGQALSIGAGLSNAYNAFTNSGTALATSGLGQMFGLSAGLSASETAAAAAVLGTDAGILGGTALAPTAGLGATFAAAAPWAALAIAAFSLFSKKGGGPKSGGSFSTTGERLFTPADSDKMLSTLGGGVVAQAAQIASRLGGSIAGSTVSIGFDTDPLGTASNRIASRVISSTGRVLLDNSAGRDVGRDASTLQTELATESKRVLLAALQAADLQGGFAEVFARLDPATAAPEAIDNLLALADQLKTLGDVAKGLPGVMGSVADLSATAREQLITFAGGLDKLTQAQSAYYTNFFSAQEQADQLQKNLSGAIKDAGGGDFSFSGSTADVKQRFRDLVESMDLTTEAGRREYAALIQLAQPMSDWINATDSLTKAAKDAADKIAEEARQKEIASLKADQTDLNTQLRKLTDANGDLTKSLDELENPTKTTAQNFIDLGQKMRSLQSELESVLGTAPQSAIEKLRDAVGVRASIFSAKDNIRDTINSSITDQFLAKNDVKGATEFLNSQIKWLFEHLSENPADYAARITSLIQQKANIASDAATKASQKEADAANEARRARMDQLSEEIDNFKQLKTIGEDISQTLLDLRTGDLSALAPKDQARLAKDNFDELFRRFQLDPTNPEIAGKLSRAGTSALQEFRSLYGSGGGYAGEFTRITGALASAGMTLADVPDQLKVAQDSLKELQETKDATATTADNSGDIITELGALSTALDGVVTEKNTEISGLVTAINGQITEWQNDRQALRDRWQIEQDNYTALKGRVDEIDDKLQKLVNNSDSAAS